MTNAIPAKSSTPEIPLREISSRAVLSDGPSGRSGFVDFILAARVKASRRGDLIATYRTLINAGVFPSVAAWSDLYRMMAARRASDEAINEARKLWREYQKSTAVPPAQNPGVNSHA